MRVLFWYCDNFNWTPALKTLDSDLQRILEVRIKKLADDTFEGVPK
ncbi:MAG: hypothetical protein GY795_39530 [Desulfobacterales bacterium]|nr:hypothetical protein [Desulfobacterales bacterium]